MPYSLALLHSLVDGLRMEIQVSPTRQCHEKDGVTLRIVTLWVLFDYFSQLMCGSVRIKEQTPQRHTSKRDWTTSSIYNNYYTLTIEHNREGLCMYILNQQTCTSNELNNVGEIRFSILFILMFVVDFPMQHKFCFVNLTSRSCRT